MYKNVSSFLKLTILKTISEDNNLIFSFDSNFDPHSVTEYRLLGVLVRHKEKAKVQEILVT